MDKKILYKDYKLDSKEELQFIFWLEEAENEKLIEKFEYHPPAWDLLQKIEIDSDETKRGKKVLFRKIEYRPDFAVIFAPRFFSLNLKPDLFIQPENYIAFFDVKGIPIISRHQTPNASMFTFPIKQHLMYAKYGIYINKVILQSYKAGKTYKPGFFEKTWVPKACAWAKGRREPKRIKAFENCKFLEELL